MTDKKTQALKLADELDAEFAQGRISNHTGRKAAQFIREALAEQKSGIKQVIELYDSPDQPPQQEPVAKPYAYEYGRDNGDGTYSVVIEKGDLVQTAPAVYNYVRPRNAHKDWPIKELFDRPPAQRTWVGLTDEEIKRMAAPWFLSMYWPICNTFAREIEAKLREKNHG